MKPYYRFKGRYKDGRKRVVIEYEENKKLVSKALPKPEVLLDRLNSFKITREKDKENGQ